MIASIVDTLGLKEKLQFAQTQVRYLGHLILDQGLLLDPDSLHGVPNFPKPKTKCQLLGFLGLVGYCWNWIPNLSLMAKPLYVLLRNDTADPISWEEQDDMAFKALKESLMNPPALGHPNHQIPFLNFVHEKEGNVLGVLTQKHGYQYRPLGYYSQQLDPVVRGSLLASEPLLLLSSWLKLQRSLLWDSL